MGEKHFIFLSYRTTDSDGRGVADLLYRMLKTDYDVEVFKDDKNIMFGDSIPGFIDEALEKKLLEIADKCPVHRTLEKGAAVVTKIATDSRPLGRVTA